MSTTVLITSPEQFSSTLASSRIVVVDFYADWCGPCKTIAPLFEQLSASLSRPGALTFTKVNIDTQQAIARTYAISSIPTFLLFKAGRETKRVKGANARELNAIVKQLAQEAVDPAAGSAGGGSSSSTSGSSAGAGGAWLGASLPRGYADITDSVDVLGLDFLNLDSGCGGPRAIFDAAKPAAVGAAAAATAASSAAARDFLLSDTDEQLMLFVPFQSSIKLHSLHITSCVPPDGAGGDVLRPRTLQLYSNRSTVLSFDEDVPCTQTVAIGPGDWDAATQTARVELRFVKFQHVSSLNIFVVDGEGTGEKTRIDRVRFVGETGEKRSMGKLEKIGDELGE